MGSLAFPHLADSQKIPCDSKTSTMSGLGNRERTFIMLKPDAVQRGLVGDIIKRFEQKGFKLVAMKMMHASEDLLKQHYADLSSKGFFPGLIKYMNSGPVRPHGLGRPQRCQNWSRHVGRDQPRCIAPWYHSWRLLHPGWP